MIQIEHDHEGSFRQFKSQQSAIFEVNKVTFFQIWNFVLMLLLMRNAKTLKMGKTLKTFLEHYFDVMRKV